MSAHCGFYPNCGCQGEYGLHCQSNLSLKEIQMKNLEAQYLQEQERLSLASTRLHTPIEFFPHRSRGPKHTAPKKKRRKR